MEHDGAAHDGVFAHNSKVDANGYQVESFYPGGALIRESGTSMASPAVANLAAKLFALDPKLTPTETNQRRLT